MSNDQNSGGMIWRWATSLLVVAILCVLFYGCGLVTEYVVITYHPEENVIRFEKAGNVAIKVKVVDLRTEVSDLGTEKEVGKFRGLAPINANNDLKKLVGYAIETELTNRGFKLGESVLIEVDLIKFFNVFGLGVHNAFADLILHVDVKKPDGALVYSNLVREKGVNECRVFIMCGKYDAKVALDRALKDGISKLVNDPEFIESLIKASGN